MKNRGISGGKPPTNRVVEGKTRCVQIAQKTPEKKSQSAKKTLKIPRTGPAVHIGVQGEAQNDKRRRGDCAVWTVAGGGEKMVTAILIGTFILLWKICVLVMRVLLKVACYLLAFIIAFVIYAVSFLFNVFTVPLLIIVHVAQKRSGGQLPYVGRRLLIFYPTFTNPKVTEANREDDQPVKVLVVQSDHWLDDPLFWSY